MTEQWTVAHRGRVGVLVIDWLFEQGEPPGWEMALARTRWVWNPQSSLSQPRTQISQCERTETKDTVSGDWGGCLHFIEIKEFSFLLI